VSLIHDYLMKLQNGMDNLALQIELSEQLKIINSKWGCHSIVYATAMSKSVPGAHMVSDDFYVIQDLLRGVTAKRILVYLQTPGGDGPTAQRIAKFLHSEFEEVHFLIAGEALSAGTILALSGHEIIMSKSGSLGPIDAQMAAGRMVFSAHDYLTWIDALRARAARENYLNPVDATIVAQITPGELEGVNTALQFAIERVEEWLPQYKFRNWDRTENRGVPVTPEMKKARAREIASELTNQQRWRSHGTRLTIEDLDKLGLKVINADDEPKISEPVERLQAILWVLFGNSPIFKLFADDKRRINQSANMPGAVQPPGVKDADVVELELQCPKCGKKHLLFAKLNDIPQAAEDAEKRGLRPYPADNILTCECGLAIDLSPQRDNIEKTTGKKFLE